MVQTDKVLEFDKVKEKWMELALTEWQKKRLRTPFLACQRMN